MGSPASIGVNDDLSAGEASISVRTADDETTRRVQVVHSLLVEVFSRYDWTDDLLHELLLDVLLGNVLGVLGRDDNGVNTDWDGLAILHSILASDLGLSVWADPWADSILANLCKAGTKRCCELMGERHEGLGLVSGVTEHDALVTSANVLQLLGVDGLRDIRTLLFNGNDYIACAVVKTCWCVGSLR